MTNLLEQAIACDDADRAAKILQDALGIASDDVVDYCFPEELAGRSRAARPHHRRMVADGSALSSLALPAAESNPAESGAFRKIWCMSLRAARQIAVPAPDREVDGPRGHGSDGGRPSGECPATAGVMANGMENGEDFFDCNEPDEKNYVHLKSPESCVKYVIGEYGARFVLNKHGYPPLVPYRHILLGCYRMVLGISQAEYDARCTSFCVLQPY